MLNNCIFSLALLSCAATLLAQSTPPATNPPAQAQPMRRGGEPCWRQVGIEKSVIEQVQSIQRDARSQVESVCSNTSLTPQQKRQQVREIHQQAMQKRESLITADQQKALTSCQQSRSGRPNGAGPHEGMAGGCGEMPHNGAQPGGSPNTGEGNGNTPAPPNQSSPQN